MCESGKANGSPEIVPINARMTERVSGNCKLNVIPLPGWKLALTTPPISWTIFLTMFKPIPLPDISVTCFAVENPGMKM